MSNRYELNKNLAQMLKGGVIMDVTTPEQAKIAEASGACAVMALERIPADIRAAGGVSRMSDPKMIKGIQNAVSIPVMAKQLKMLAPRRVITQEKWDAKMQNLQLLQVLIMLLTPLLWYAACSSPVLISFMRWDTMFTR